MRPSAGACRVRGHDVRSTRFSADLFTDGEFDGVWILNCFEALDDLHETLEHVSRVVRPGGRLVIRTPNAAFVGLAHTEPADPRLRARADRHGLLGIPFRRCLSPAGIVGLLAGHGFRVADLHGPARPWMQLCATACVAPRPSRRSAAPLVQVASAASSSARVGCSGRASSPSCESTSRARETTA